MTRLKIICFMSPGNNSHSQNAYKNHLFFFHTYDFVYPHLHIVQHDNYHLHSDRSNGCHEKTRTFDGEGKVPSHSLLFCWNLCGAKSVTVQ